jgi:hypothetical protein
MRTRLVGERTGAGRASRTLSLCSSTRNRDAHHVAAVGATSSSLASCGMMMRHEEEGGRGGNGTVTLTIFEPPSNRFSGSFRSVIFVVRCQVHVSNKM